MDDYCGLSAELNCSKKIFWCYKSDILTRTPGSSLTLHRPGPLLDAIGITFLQAHSIVRLIKICSVTVQFRQAYLNTQEKSTISCLATYLVSG